MCDSGTENRQSPSGGPDRCCRTHRLETEPLVALLPPSLPFRAAVDDAAAGSMFWEAMSSGVAVTAGETGRGQRHWLESVLRNSTSSWPEQSDEVPNGPVDWAGCHEPFSSFFRGSFVLTLA